MVLPYSLQNYKNKSFSPKKSNIKGFFESFLLLKKKVRFIRKVFTSDKFEAVSSLLLYL